MFTGSGYNLRIEKEELSGKFKEKAMLEDEETPENVEKSLKHLREFLKGK